MVAERFGDTIPARRRCEKPRCNLGGCGGWNEAAPVICRLALSARRMLWQIFSRRDVFRISVPGQHLGTHGKKRMVRKKWCSARSVNFRAHDILIPFAKQG